MTDGIVLELLLLLVLVALSALLNGAEAAYFSLGRTRLRRMKEAGADPSVRVPLIDRPNDLLVTLLVGITLINIAASAIAATVAERLFGPRFAIVLETIVMVLVLTTFTEVLPMTLAVKRPEQFLTLAGRPVAWLGTLLAPARVLLGGLTALVVRISSRGQAREPELTEEELRTLVDVGATEGVASSTRVERPRSFTRARRRARARRP